jgi:hypothetical protein
MDYYEIKNGLLGMLRDINLKLTKFLDDNKIRVLFGVSQKYFEWKNHFLFKLLHIEKLKYTMNNILRVGQSTFKLIDNNFIMKDIYSSLVIEKYFWKRCVRKTLQGKAN